MSITICKMTADMLKDYVDLLTNTFDSVFCTEDSLKSIINDENYILLAALKDEKFVGGLILAKIFDPVRLPNEFYFVLYFAVKSNLRRQGIGRQLLNHVKKLAKENKISRIELTCANFRTDSHKFYEANGFTVKKDESFYTRIAGINFF